METKHCLFFFAFGLASLCLGQNKGGFDLNDPRNPSCPCHKIQKLAEDQYSGQIKESKTSGKIKRDNKDQKIYLNDDLRKSVKKCFKKIQNMKFNYSKRKMLRKKVRPDYSVCFKW